MAICAQMQLLQGSGNQAVYYAGQIFIMSALCTNVSKIDLYMIVYINIMSAL